VATRLDQVWSTHITHIRLALDMVHAPAAEDPTRKSISTRLPVNHQAVAAQLDESMRGKGIVQNLDVGVQNVSQLGVAHVPYRHKQQPRRSPCQQV
jgi:hypothetical protein